MSFSALLGITILCVIVLSVVRWGIQLRMVRQPPPPHQSLSQDEVYDAIYNGQIRAAEDLGDYRDNHPLS